MVKSINYLVVHFLRHLILLIHSVHIHIHIHSVSLNIFGQKNRNVGVKTTCCRVALTCSCLQQLRTGTWPRSRCRRCP